jgi:hypothetical protein
MSWLLGTLNLQFKFCNDVAPYQSDKCKNSCPDTKNDSKYTTTDVPMQNFYCETNLQRRCNKYFGGEVGACAMAVELVRCSWSSCDGGGARATMATLVSDNGDARGARAMVVELVRWRWSSSNNGDARGASAMAVELERQWRRLWRSSDGRGARVMEETREPQGRRSLSS